MGVKQIGKCVKGAIKKIWFKRRKKPMTEQDAIKLLKGMQNPLEDYADMVCASVWACGHKYVYPEPEDYAIDVAIAVLKEKESRKWIPVAEHLPEEQGYYWVTMRHIDGTFTTEKYFWEPGWSCEDAWREVIVSWQPYYCPEPYQQLS